MQRLLGCAQGTDNWPGLHRASVRASTTASLTGALQRLTGRRRPQSLSPADVSSQPSQASVDVPASITAPSVVEPDAGRDGNGAHPAARQRRRRHAGR